jgi:hypothetical protein
MKHYAASIGNRWSERWDKTVKNQRNKKVDVISRKWYKMGIGV